MSKVKLGRGSKETRQAVARFVLRPDGFARSIGRTTVEAATRTVPGAATAPPQRHTPRAQVLDLRLPQIGQQRCAARPQHGAGRPADVARREKHLRRLRRLRRGGPPRGRQPDRGAQRPRVTGPGARRPREHVAHGARAATTSSSSPTTGSRKGCPSRSCNGKSLGRSLRRAHQRDVLSLEENVESWGRVESVFDDLAGDDSLGQPHGSQGGHPDAVAFGAGEGAGDGRRPRRARLREPRPGLRPRAKRLLAARTSSERWPRLLPGLATTPGIGFVAVHEQGARSCRDRRGRGPTSRGPTSSRA